MGNLNLINNDVVDTNSIGAFNKELINNENTPNKEDNEIENVSNNEILEYDYVVNGVKQSDINSEIVQDNISIIEEKNISNNDVTTSINKICDKNVIYIPENNNMYNSIELDYNKTHIAPNINNISPVLSNELSYAEARNNYYSEEDLLNHLTLRMLEKKKIFIHMTSEGEYRYKFGYNGTLHEVKESKLKKILKNKLGFTVYIDSENPENKDKNIDTSCLHLVTKDDFNPHEDKEFFHEDGQTYHNSFIKTEYLLLDNNSEYNEPSTIIAFVKNLVNNDEKRFTYFINWLANFIQTMERTPIAIIIKGKQGTGKNLFVDEVLKPIFGEKQVSVIGDKEIRKQFTAPLFENKLFYALDEISHSYKDNYNLQNFLKQVIGTNKVFMEKKHENTKEEIRLWGPVLIFSNKSVPIAIESNSRREVVFKSGKSLTEIDFLGCGSYENLCERIHSELKDFTLYLKNWEVDKNMASIAMNTPEKEALANMTHDKAALFNEAITSGDINYFDELKDNESSIPSISLYKELEEDLKVYRVKKNYLAQLYNTLYEEKISTKTLMNLLRTYDDEFYNNINTIGDGRGGKYFLLDGHPKKGIINDEYVENVAVQNTLIVNSIVKPLLSTLQ